MFDPQQIANQLIKLKKKQYASRLKANNLKSYYQRVQEYNFALQVEKKVRLKTCQSGIGEERIRQME